MSLATLRMRWSQAMLCAAVAGCGISGCVAPLSTADQKLVPAEAAYPERVQDRFPVAIVEPVESSTEVVETAAVEVQPAAASPSVAVPTVDDTKALGDALTELRSQGAIDAATQAQLFDGLEKTDPALWPQLLAYFRAAADTKRETSKVIPIEEAKLVSATEPAATLPEPEKSSEPTAKKPDKPASASKRVKPKSAKAADTAKAKSTSDWQQHLATSIAKLEKQTSHPPANNAEIGHHAALRMLYLAAGRRDDALKPIAGIPPAQQDFWSKELYGLAAYLDHGRNADASRRAAEANNHFREATARLGEVATLQVRNLAFCSEVTSYGVYKPFETAEYQAGQELLLYAEIENFKSDATEKGYHTALKASYQILDERGARVDEKEFAITEEHCQNPRRDFFIRYFVWMPQKIYGGTYTLQLSVEDTLSQKIGQASLEFKIKGK